MKKCSKLPNWTLMHYQDNWQCMDMKHKENWCNWKSLSAESMGFIFCHVVRSRNRQEPHPGRSKPGHNSRPEHHNSIRFVQKLFNSINFIRTHIIQNPKILSFSKIPAITEPWGGGGCGLGNWCWVYVHSFVFRVKNYSCVVVLDNYDKEFLVGFNQKARDNNVGFIYGGNLGLYGFVFVDFG